MATPVSGKASYSQSKTEQAKSGDIKTGMMYNVSSVGSIGTVKLLVVKLVSVWGKGDYSYQKYLEIM